MTDLRVKGDVTKNRLLESTENLIAEMGFDAVSVRDITGRAKANVAAVNYHFGSREGLLAAVLEHRMKPLAESRTKQLEALTAEDGVREVLQAWVKPLTELMSSAGLPEKAYFRVMGRCMEVISSNAFAEATQLHLLVGALWQSEMEKRLPVMTAQDISWRLHFAIGGLIHLLVHGSVVKDDFRLSAALDQWIEAINHSFGGADVSLERNHREVKAHSPRRKGKTTPQMRQVAEVVSAAMSIDEEARQTPENGTPFTDNQHETMTADDLAPVASESPTKKKKKDEQSFGELFLF